MTRRSMMGLVREAKSVRGSGFMVTWDVDSRDRSATNRLEYFLFGGAARTRANPGAYQGFVRKEGVRYLAQFALFVKPHMLAELRNFLEKSGIDHDVEAVAFV